MDGSFKTVLKVGCLGCAGMVFIVIVAGIALFLLLKAEFADESPVMQELSYRAAPHDALNATVVGGVNENETVSERASAEESKTHSASASTPLRIVLDLQPVGLEISKGKAGDGVKIQAEFDKRYYRLEELRESSVGGGSVYTIRLRAEKTGFFTSLGRLFFSSPPTVEALLPPDQLLALEVRAAEGGGNIELGGLWLTDMKIECEDGRMLVGFSEPTRSPLDSFTIRVLRGSVDTVGVGNASPRRLTLDVSTAGSVMDLRGAWQDDAAAEIAVHMGSMQVFLPDTIGIRGLRSPFEKLNHEPEADLNLPTLSIDYNAEMGKVAFGIVP